MILPLLSPSVAYGSDALEKGRFYIVIENKTDGAIEAINRMGQGDVLSLGHVLAPVANISPSAFTASGWGKIGCVTATAVNAIHLKVGQNAETGFGKVFSVMPVEFVNFDPTNYHGFFNKDAALYTDIKAGTGLFGGGFAPKVGDAIYVSPSPDSAADRIEKYFSSNILDLPGAGLSQTTAGLKFFRCPDEFAPVPGDVLIIDVVPSLQGSIEWIEFDNKFGGFITQKNIGDDEPEVIGQVYKPVFGVGRFDGTLYCGPGRIRANHPGVIDISTSPIGEIGGIQIIPLEHGMSPEMKNARILTQWMVVGPVDPRLSPKWEGLSPLFSGVLYPAYIPVSDERFSGSEVFLDRFIVVARLKDKEGWQLMPVHTGRDDEALLNLEGLRILFPVS